MGNRANVIFTDGKQFSPGVYLHWNGGPESVYAFLDELERRRAFHGIDYMAARFVQIVAEFFDSDGHAETLSLGIFSGPKSIDDLAGLPTDHGDNGFFIIERKEDGFFVRRFRVSYDTGKAIEHNRQAVETEAKIARQSSYYHSIREVIRVKKIQELDWQSTPGYKVVFG